MAIDPACFEAAKKAAGGTLTDKQVREAFEQVEADKAKLSGRPNQSEALRRVTITKAERTRIAAAMQRRHASLNVLIRDRLERQISSYIKSGLSPKESLLAILEGSKHGVEGARESVFAAQQAFEADYLGKMFADVARDRPHLVKALRDPKLDSDILREMAEIKKDGKPGITGNEDAKYVAKLFSTYTELSRTELNRYGASIGKLDGWSGVQSHDDLKMIAAGKDVWIQAIVGKLDLERTFPDATTAEEIQEALDGIYDTITTGMSNKATPGEKGQRVNPANMAKSLGKSRVLHFKDAEATLAYRDQFGYGNTVSGIFGHQRRAAKMAALMSTLGPNPEVMFDSLVESMRRTIRDSDMSPKEKAEQSKGLMTDAGALRHALDISTGLISRPVNVNGAKISSDIRAVQSMAKLGGAVLSSMSDNVTAGLASQFRGGGFFNGFVAQLDGIRKGRPKEEMAEISYILGEGFDGLLGHIVSPAAANDGVVGRLSKLQETFFKYNALSWWTDVQRASAGRMISAEMGMRAKTGFAELPAAYKHVLGMHSIGAKEWSVIQQGQFREVNGKTYITPDRIRDMDAEAFKPLVQDRLDALKPPAQPSSKGQKAMEAYDAKLAKYQASVDRILEDGRRGMELKVSRFFADETSYGVVETDARSQRTTTWGNRPGTPSGEGIRFIAQFKGFPVAFVQRVLGRATYGFRKDAKLDQVKHIGALVAGMTMAGYASMTMKDIQKGYWPPRNPADWETLGAAFVQGGAAGIYGDFLFGRVNRFGGGVLETVAGPGIGAITEGLELAMKVRNSPFSDEGQVKLADWLNYATQNTPFINLLYVRPALDFLFLNSLKEVATPGYMKKVESKRKADYGQTKADFMPSSLMPFQ